MVEYEVLQNGIRINNPPNFDLAQTLDCGQAFRWSQNDGVWSGVAGGRYIELYSDENGIVLKNTTESDFTTFWADYFDLERDYGKIISEISTDKTLKTAASYGSGIRILHQEPYEALCSFIISQNNNIPRIKGIIERLCRKCGEKKGEHFAFPSAEKVAALSEQELRDIGCGFRARYVLDAAKKVADGTIDLECLKKCDTKTALDTLMSIKGVGPKVADCTMLFGLNRIEAFPQDVWIKRAMKNLFPNGLPECAVPYAGIVQQYIFYYARNNL